MLCNISVLDDVICSEIQFSLIRLSPSTITEPSDRSSARSLSQTSLWPSHLFFSVPMVPMVSMSSPGGVGLTTSMAHAHAQASRARSQSQSSRVIRLDTMQTWVKQRQQQQSQTLAMVTFMPDRLRDPNANAVNQTNFRNLSRVLWDAQAVSRSYLTCERRAGPILV